MMTGLYILVISWYVLNATADNKLKDIIMDHPRFRCNGCKRDTEFLWLDQLDTPEGFKAYQCMDCGCVGIKNVVEALHVPDEDICRCGKCGGWMFAAVACHTCRLIAAK